MSGRPYIKESCTFCKKTIGYDYGGHGPGKCCAALATPQRLATVKTTVELPETNTLTKYRILPPDFKLEAHFLEDGRLETNKMGLDRFGERRFSVSNRFLQQLFLELQTLVGVTYKLSPNEIIVLSDYNFEGDMLLWLRSTRPVDKEFLQTQAPPKELEKGSKIVEADIIDI